MARINHSLDKELAQKGLLRISVVAKALKLAPKTVNAWTQYPITKVGGVKYLTWSDIYSDRQSDCALFNLVADSVSVHAQATNTKVPVTIKVLSALEKAKALLPKKLPPRAPTQELVKEFNIPDGVKAPTLALQYKVEEPVIQDVILTPLTNEEDILTIPTELKHLARRR